MKKQSIREQVIALEDKTDKGRTIKAALWGSIPGAFVGGAAGTAAAEEREHIAHRKISDLRGGHDTGLGGSDWLYKKNTGSSGEHIGGEGWKDFASDAERPKPFQTGPVTHGERIERAIHQIKKDIPKTTRKLTTGGALIGAALVGGLFAKASHASQKLEAQRKAKREANKVKLSVRAQIISLGISDRLIGAANAGTNTMAPADYTAEEAMKPGATAAISPAQPLNEGESAVSRLMARLRPGKAANRIYRHLDSKLSGMVQLKATDLGTDYGSMYDPCCSSACKVAGQKKYYPSLYISDRADDLDLPMTGTATIKYKLRSKTTRQDEEGKKKHSAEIEVQSIDPDVEEEKPIKDGAKQLKFSVRLKKIVKKHKGVEERVPEEEGGNYMSIRDQIIKLDSMRRLTGNVYTDDSNALFTPSSGLSEPIRSDIKNYPHLIKGRHVRIVNANGTPTYETRGQAKITGSIGGSIIGGISGLAASTLAKRPIIKAAAIGAGTGIGAILGHNKGSKRTLTQDEKLSICEQVIQLAGGYVNTDDGVKKERGLLANWKRNAVTYAGAGAGIGAVAHSIRSGRDNPAVLAAIPIGALGGKIIDSIHAKVSSKRATGHESRIRKEDEPWLARMSVREKVIALADPRSRNNLGEFSGAEDGAPSPNAIGSVYKQPSLIKQAGASAAGTVAGGGALAGLKALIQKSRKV